MDAYTSPSFELLTIAECVVLRPRMYTATGSLAEVLAILEGIEIGQRHSKRRPKDQSASKALNWLATESGLEGTIHISPQARLAAIRNRFSSDEHVFGELIEYLKKIRS